MEDQGRTVNGVPSLCCSIDLPNLENIFPIGGDEAESDFSIEMKTNDILRHFTSNFIFVYNACILI